MKLMHEIIRKGALFILCTGTAALLPAGCTKEEKPVLSVAPAPGTILFGAKAEESYTFRVRTDQTSWNAFSDQSWCIVTKDAANDTFTVTARPNDAESAPEKAVVTVTAGGAQPLTITASQQGAEYAIYIGGMYLDETTGRMLPCYWKNGVQTDLPIPDGTEADTTNPTYSVSVSDGSVYVDGSYYISDRNNIIPCYWKDGIRTDLPLPEGTQKVIAGAFYSSVLDGSIHIIGSLLQDYDADWSNCYWKDGVLSDLPASAKNGYLVSIAAAEGAVYIAGAYFDDAVGEYVTGYWKEGNFTGLDYPAGATNCDPSDIAIPDGSVYVTGNYKIDGRSFCCYWKDGVRTDLPLPAEIWSPYSRGIAVSEGSVYVGGNYEDKTKRICCFWKDGARTDLKLPEGATNMYLARLAVANGSVYIAGEYATEENTTKGFLWKDGTWLDFGIRAKEYLFLSLTIVKE